MGLLVYYKDDDDQFVEVSSDTDLNSPITTVHDGKKGDVKTVQLFLRNDDAALWFSNIRVVPVDILGDNDIYYTETGWGVKLSPGDVEPTEGEWDDIDWGEEIEMEDVGSDSAEDTTTYYPFWYLITCPPNEDVAIKTDIILEVNYTENSVA